MSERRFGTRREKGIDKVKGSATVYGAHVDPTKLNLLFTFFLSPTTWCKFELAQLN